MGFFHYFLSFFFVINIIVLVHEYGHYLAAKKLGVKILKFSLGIGPEIFGVTDKSGTRWCCSLLPIGGFVMMLGDGDIASSTTDDEAIATLSNEDKKMAITSKSNWEKMIISFCGPFFNYLYAFVVMVAMSCFYGAPKHDAVIGEVLKDSPAEIAGMCSGDRILSLDGKKIEKYRDILKHISEENLDSYTFLIDRNGSEMSLKIEPKIIEKRKLFGGVKKTKQIGIRSGVPVFEKKSFLDSIGLAFSECVVSTKEMFGILVKLFTGKKSLDDFGSVVHMASVAGDLSQRGSFALIVMFTVTLSMNLGFINLFPLPVLDGGNIFVCLLEQIIGRKINKKIQEYIMVFCAALLIFLMLIMVANDIIRFEAVNSFISNLLG